MFSPINQILTVACFMFLWSTILPKDWFRLAIYKHEQGSLRVDKSRTLFSRRAEPLKGFVHLFSQRRSPPTEPAPNSCQTEPSPKADPNVASSKSFPDPHDPHNAFIPTPIRGLDMTNSSKKGNTS